MQINQQFSGISTNDSLSERDRRKLLQMEAVQHFLNANKNGKRSSDTGGSLPANAVEIPQNHYFFSADGSNFTISTEKRLIIVPNAPFSMMPKRNIETPEVNRVFSGFSSFPRGNGSLMDIGHLLSRTKPSMNDEEFFEIVRELAKIDAGKDIIWSDEWRTLMTDFVSVVSPDRQSIVANGVKSMGLPFDMGSATSLSGLTIKEGGQIIASYSTNEGWTANWTPAESARLAKITEVYVQAWKEAGGKDTAKNVQLIKPFNRTA